MRVFEIEGYAGTYESLTTATVVGFTSGKILPTSGPFENKKARAVIISVEVADIRFTLEGTTPTVTAGTGAGHILANGSSYVIAGEANVTNFRCINAVAGSGALAKCTFFFGAELGG